MSQLTANGKKAKIHSIDNMTAVPGYKYALEQYLEIEGNSEEKFEFFNGRVTCVSGASLIHERILGNLAYHLRGLLCGRGCSIFGSNLKIKVPACEPYRHADLSAYCGEGICETMGGLEVLTNPQMSVEILSPST